MRSLSYTHMARNQWEVCTRETGELGIDRKLFQDIYHKMLRQETFCTLQMDEYVEDETKIFLFNLIIWN
jgi:hypothetical protein